MNKKILLLAICFTMINSFMFGQAWKIGGNPNADVPLPGGEFGTNGNRFVIFETNGTERARMLNDDGHGFWGFGEKAPNARVHITSPAGEDPFRVTADGNSALYVNQNSGVSVGVGFTPPSHGLYVWGYTGLGTTDPKTRLHVTGGTDASPGGGGYITTGVLTSTNVTLDDNEIMARNNGAAADFFINHNGGNVVIDGSNSGSKVGIGITPTRDLDINHGVGSGANHGLRLRNNGGNNEDWTLYTENSTGDLTFYTDGSTKASIDETGVYHISDKRLKKDIEDAGPILEKINQLEVKKYNFINGKERKYKTYGLIAQDVEKVFPEIVKHSVHDDSTESYSLNYSAFGVLAIKAIQEQQKKLDAQDKKIEELTKLVNQLMQDRSGAQVSSLESNAVKVATKPATNAMLEQNAPNPFSSNTIIRYNVPASISNAQIIVSNASGNLIKTFTLINKGAGSVTIKAGELAAGNYYYTLIVDGKKADSKQMILNK